MAAMKADGTVWVWGDNTVGQLALGGECSDRTIPAPVVGITNVTTVAAGLRHTLALKDDGTVWAWGYNSYGQLGMGISDSVPHPAPVQVAGADGMPLIGAMAISAGGNHSLAVLNKQVYVRVVIDNAYVTVPEGGTAGIQVRLSAAPAAAVTVTALRAEGDTDITGSTLTFTPGNWSTNQTMTFAAAEDADMENGSAVFILSGSAGVDFGATVYASEADNDVTLALYATPGGTVSPAGAGAATALAATPITAVPAPRYIFANWRVVSGAALIADPYATNTTVLLVGAAGVQANFLPIGENLQPRISTEAWAAPAEVWLPAALSTVRVAAMDPDGDALTYAWSKLSGAGAATFATPAAAESAVTFDRDGIYILRATVSDGRGGVVSSDVSVTVNRQLALPSITRQPFNLLVCLGEIAGFVVVATGDDLSYQWYRNGVEIFSGTAAGYSPPWASMADNGAKFKVRVSNASGSVMSSEATLTVLNAAPGTGLTGKYYDNMDFTGLYQTKVEYVSQGADPRCSTFSKQWTGQVRPQFTETYWFNVRAMGDVRLWVNGVLLVDTWRGVDVDLGMTACGPIQLEAGKLYDVRLDFRGDYSHGNGPYGYNYDGGINLRYAGLLTTAGVLPDPGHVPIPYGEAAVGVPTTIPAARLYPTLSGTNYPPQITSATIADNPVCLPAGTTVTLSAADMEDDPLTYAWSQVSGPGTATFATPSGSFTSVVRLAVYKYGDGYFTCAVHSVSVPVAPTSAVTFSAGGEYVLRATVSDNQGRSVTSDIPVTVIGADVPPYIILSSPTAGVRESVQDYSGGVFVRLSKAPTNSFQLGVTRTGSAANDLLNAPIPSFSPSDWSTYKSVGFRSSQDVDTNNDTAVFTISAPGYPSVTCTVTQEDDDTTLTVAAGIGGTVSPVVATVVTKGVNTAIYSTSVSGYGFANWTVTSGSATFANAGAANTTVAISAPATVQANFVTTPIELVRSATTVSVPEGGTATFQLKLSCQPTGTVVVAVARTSGDSDREQRREPDVHYEQLEHIPDRHPDSGRGYGYG